MSADEGYSVRENFTPAGTRVSFFTGAGKIDNLQCTCVAMLIMQRAQATVARVCFMHGAVRPETRSGTTAPFQIVGIATNCSD